MPATVVIGAGPAGLSAAYELSKHQRGGIVLESSRDIGGLSQTATYRGNRFDIGGHRFYTKAPLVEALWNELLDDEFIERDRLSRIIYGGKFFHYPLKPLNALAGLGPVETVRCLASFARAKIGKKGEERTFEDWVVHRFGRRLFEIFFKTYTEKVWGMPCSEIGADWASQRIMNLNLGRAIYDALRPKGWGSGGAIAKTLIDRFRYPRLGPGQMWETCVDRIGERGFDTRFDAKVVKLRHLDGRVTEVVVEDRAGHSEVVSADHFLSSMPIRELIEGLDPAPPEAVLEAARKLRYRDFLTVGIIVDREDLFPDNWLYVHSPEVQLGRIQNYKNWSPDMVANPAHSTLGLEYFVNEGDELWNMADDDLIRFGTLECSTLGLIQSNEVLDGTVIRAPKAYPVYDRENQPALEVIRDYLSALGNLQLIGRNGQHRYNNQDHSMLTGIYAARNIVGADYDLWSVNADAEYGETITDKEQQRWSERSVPLASAQRRIPS